MKRRLVITSLISIILVCILLIGSTYSIFTTGDIDENANVYTTGNLDVTYTLSSDNVKMTDTTPMSVDDSIKIKPYRITVTNNGNMAYKFDVVLNDTSTGDRIDYQYIMTQVGQLEAKSLNNCTNNIIKSDVIIGAGKSVVIDVRVWLADNIKNSEIGKSFYAKLAITGVATYDGDGDNNDNLVADRLSLASSYIKDLYNDGSTIKDIYIGGNSNKPMIHVNDTKGIILDNNGEYRYYGKNPDNYVKYNDELYRIVSVANVKKNDNGIGENRLKIIKDMYLDKILDYGVNNNDYSVSTVSAYLNDTYYESFSNNAKGLIDDAVYYLGAINEDNYSSDIYLEERGSNVCNGCNKDRKTSWIGKVGLMYPSDYMYATDLSLCLGSSSKYNDSSCVDNNWLVGDNELTIIPSINNVGDVIAINNGIIDSNSKGLKVRPVIYLKSSVSIVSGNGTKDNPYVLGILK